ncbi:polymer-forming cytoskeletal protein [Microbacterium sulfonylureivorans]|uniref:polymer-forming cytoskeletal protein n=1 Tax=Microbacterium sulfonylureivorans TaxID=2486854 RepID=UPI001F0B8429|nr:polymer-forming cytoskeletal protein [Microbacterium sulfonylureivorans]
MLVTRGARLADPGDRGSTLVSALVVMLVLSIGGLALAAIVTNTTATLSDSRSTAQSRASADAGLAEAVSALRRGSLACPGALHDVRVDGTDAKSPTFSYSVTCGAGVATITATGKAGTGMTTTQAVYRYTETPSIAGDMVFFGTGSVDFTYEVRPMATGRLLDIVVPQATFDCHTMLPGNITVGGNIEASGGCTIKGNVRAGGIVDICCASDTIEGDLSTSGTGAGKVEGTILGNIHANGALNFGWGGKRVGKSVTTSGNVSLGNVRIDGTLTLPSTRTFNQDQGAVTGGVVRPSTVAGPTPPTLPPWFEYKYKAADWPGYAVVTLVNSGSGPGSCGYFNESPGTGWTSLAGYSAPTIIDARACTNLRSGNGSTPVVSIKTNLVILAKNPDLTTLTMKAAAGLPSKPKVWFVTEDITPTDNKPSCGSGYGPTIINGTVTATSIAAMIYTPCKITVSGNAGGIRDAWSGSFYGGGWSHGSGLDFTADPIALPGMSSGSGAGGGTGLLGALVSQRDIAPQEIP